LGFLAEARSFPLGTFPSISIFAWAEFGVCKRDDE
jgi:hypothetical protein